MTEEIKHTVRALVRAPGYSTIIVVTLALAIGATTTIYSVVSGVLLEPLPFAEQDRLVMLWQRAPGVGVTEDWFSPAQYFDIREGTPSLQHVAVTYGQEVTLTGDDIEPTRLGAMRVSSSFFDVLGIRPAHGRRFEADDDIADTPRKVMLGHRMFTQWFGGDPSIVGASVTLDEQRLEVVGVLPPLMLDGDIMPTLLTVPVFDLLVSLPMSDPQLTRRGSENYNIIGKLADGATPAQLDAELLRVAAEFSRDPGSLAAGLDAGSEFFIGVVPLLDQVVGGARSYLLVLLGATGVLLLIACANVANLMLTRAATQRRELSIRSSLGAPRARMILQTMLESVLLSTLGGAAGLAIAWAGVQALHAAAPDELPRLAEVAIDPAVLTFGATLCLLSSVLFGLGPALRTSGVAPGDVLRETAASVQARSVWRRGGSRFLVVAQVALSLLLLIGAGLLVREFAELRSVDPGFRASGSLSFRVSLAGERYSDGAERVRFYEQLFDRLRSTPGISTAGGTSLLPLTRGLAWTDYLVEGFNEDNPEARIVADVMTMTPGYVEAMGIDVIAGRSFAGADAGNPPVVIVNRMFAERFWPAEDAVGKWIATDPTRPMTIVGVTETVRHYGLDDATRPAVFYPHRGRANRALFGVVTQDPDAPAAAAIDSAADPMAALATVLDTVRELDPRVPVYDAVSMPDRLAHSLAKQRVLMWLLNFFGGTALVLATVGLYGVLSFAVATHRRELGIRKALGAQRADLYRLVLRGAGIVTAIGILLGAAAAASTLRLLDGLVFGIETGDPVSYGMAITVVSAVALAASLLPARRAAGVDPMVALKQE